MERTFRSSFNAAYTPDFYKRYLGKMSAEFGAEVPFRLAETPLFLPKQLRTRLATAATELVQAISDPVIVARGERAVPAEFAVPRRDALANCIQVDLAITQEPDGSLGCKLVELQGFPSLYAFTVFQAAALTELMREVRGLDRPWTCLFNGLDYSGFVERFRRAIVGDCDPREVVLVDLDPASQKTVPDFIATQKLLGVDAICPTQLHREGRTLYREVDGKLVQVRRIYHRVVFDELLRKGTRLPFAYSDDLDVRWVPHPNWYWIWSKHTLPMLDHPAVPRATLLSELDRVPEDLSNYVLKPLFSFAGSGVRVDVTREDLDAVPDAERANWMLQERIAYAPALLTPEGHGVKAEVRMMFLRSDEQSTPELTLNLVRLSRGKMHGVDHNRDLDWVGGTVGLWPSDE